VSSTLVRVPYGAAATKALGEIIRELQGDDRLAPVDVVVPSAVAGMTVRRQLADPGLANVRFSSLPQLAERLALRSLALTDRRPLTATARSHAVRAAVAAGTGPLAGAARHPQTETLLADLFAELDEAEAATALPNIASFGAGPAELVSLYGAYRTQVGAALDSAAMVRAAAEAVRAGTAPVSTVVLHAPRRLSSAELDLLQSLADLQRLRVVLCDPADTALVADLHDLVGAVPADAPPLEQGEREFVVAPDPDEEVRLAARAVADALHDKTLRPERIGIGYRSPVPYTRLISEQLRVAGIPHHVPSGRRLPETVTGRLLLGLLDLHRSDFARADVIAWMTDGPVRTADGKAVPVARWDRLSRDAGISRGLQTWQDRLATLRAGVETRQAEAADDDQRAGYERRLGDIDSLAAFLGHLVSSAETITTATTWSEAAGALRTALEELTGGFKQVERWGRGTSAEGDAALEQAAYQAVHATLGGLAHRDQAGVPPTPDDLRVALLQELDRAAPGRTILGRGVVVAPLRDLAGADLELLVVVGMTEEALPARVRENPLLRDDARAAVGRGLRTVADRRAQDRRDFVAAIAGARKVILSFPRADSRAQRRQHPSPWFMEQLQSVHGPLRSAQVLDAASGPGLLAPASFVAALAQGGSLGPAEHDLVLAMSGRSDEIDEPRFQLGRTAVRDRRDGDFSAWTGHVGPLPEPLATQADQRLSATSLQEWATCPSTFLMRRVLDVRDLDSTDDDRISALDRGSLVHDALERFFSDHLGTLDTPGISPDTAWSAEDIRRARGFLNEFAAVLEAKGLTGRPLLWKAELARLNRQLARILSIDSRLRAQRRSWPMAVELPFGRHGVPPLEVELPTAGRVPFAGSVDRVDVTESGDLVVIDYKTGGGKGYDAIPKLGANPKESDDLVDRGRKLQLVLYAMATRARFSPPTRSISAYYWFVEQGELHRGAAVGSEEEARLLEVLDVTVRGIREGVYPAHPGDWNGWSGWEGCRFCPYDRACASSRGEVWLSISTADPVRAYAELTGQEQA
jgi:ATP-dependent helicase/nuclease subunit B